MMTESHRRVLLALAGDKQVLASLPPESALLCHLPAAQAAMEAFCQGDAAAMQTALTKLPFRSPYRDLRWLLKGLASYPEHSASGRRFLAKIAPDSPFHLPARIADAILTGKAPSTSPPVQAFVAAFRRPAPADMRAMVQRLVDRFDGKSDAELLKASLAHEPSVIPVYQRQVAPLTEAERLRIRALHEEHYGDRHRAYELWSRLLAIQQQQEPLKAAAIAQHLADLAAKLYGADNHRVVRRLNQAKSLDPDNRAVWLKLATYYRQRQETGRLRQTLTGALARFPGDGEMLLAAAQAAIDRGACQKAAEYAKRLLQQDPINNQAGAILFRSRVVQARKHIAARRGDLARKALAEAQAVVRSDRGRAQVLVLQGMAALIGGRHSQAEAWFHQARRLLAPPRADWMIAIEALLTQPPAVAGSLLKQVRLILGHAGVNPDKSTMVILLRDATGLADVDPDAARILLKAGSCYFRKLAHLEWSLGEIENLGEHLLALECYQWLRDLVRSHPQWVQSPPLLVYLDIAAKCRGVAENLNLRDAGRLLQALDQTSEDHKVKAQIEQLLEGYQTAFPLRLPVETGESLKRVAADRTVLLEQRMESAVKTMAAWLNLRRWIS